MKDSKKSNSRLSSMLEIESEKSLPISNTLDDVPFAKFDIEL